MDIDKLQNNTFIPGKTQQHKLSLCNCEVLKEFEFHRIGDIINLFSYDYDRITKQYPDHIKFIKVVKV